MTDILVDSLDDAPLFQNNKTKDFTLIMLVMYVEKSTLSKEQETCLGEPKKERCPSLSKPRRKVLFLICNLAGIICYIIAMSWLYVPYLLVPWYISASSLFILSMIFLWGPTDCVKRLCTLQGAVFILTYGSAIAGVLYFSQMYRDDILIIIMIGQVAILLWFIVSNIPGGRAFGMFLLNWITEKIDKLLPII